MDKQKRQAFTLVELIVVITILAILGTIAFISLQGYSKDARNSTRMTDTASMRKTLELYQLRKSNLPLPDNVIDVTYSNELLRTQGKFGESVGKTLGKLLSKVPLDPLTETPYIYSVENSKKQYEILTIYEGDNYASILNKANAINGYTPKITGSYNGVFVKTDSYIIPTPSIINAEIDENTVTELELNDNTIKSQVVNGQENIPAIGEEVTSENGSLENLDLSVANISSGSLEENKAEIILALKETYDGTLISNNEKIDYVLTSIENGEENDIFDYVVTGNSISSPASSDNNGETGGGETTPTINQSPTAEVTFEDHTTETLDGVVGYYTQNTTGLKWQASDDGNTYKWSSDTSYTEPIWNGVSYDYPTGEGQTGNASTDYPAFEYCDSLGGGGASWRLPTKRELFSIMTDTKPDGMSYFTALHSIDSYNYWSSTACAHNTNYAWYGYFNFGYTYNNTKTYTLRVLCIHD